MSHKWWWRIGIGVPVAAAGGYLLGDLRPYIGGWTVVASSAWGILTALAIVLFIIKD